jgi:hypothetical protein
MTSIDLNKIRVAFMERVSAPNIPPHALKLAYLLAFKYMNRRTWSARPAQETLARDLNVSVRTIQRLLDILEPLGLTVMPGDGRGYASTYSLDPERVSRVSSFPAQKGDKKGRQKPPKRVTPVSPQPSKEPSTEGECLRTPPSAGERERASREIESLDFGGGLDGRPKSSQSTTPPPSSRRERKGPSKEEPVAEIENDSPSLIRGEKESGGAVPQNLPAVLDGDWCRLRELWQRGWASDDTAKVQAIARNAFRSACALAEPKDILDGARTWIAAADAPRFLPPLPQWLDAKGWEKPPPMKKPHRRGAVHRGRGDHLPRSNGRKVDLTRLALKMGGYVEDENGKLYHPDGDYGSSFDWRAGQ